MNLELITRNKPWLYSHLYNCSFSSPSAIFLLLQNIFASQDFMLNLLSYPLFLSSISCLPCPFQSILFFSSLLQIPLWLLLFRNSISFYASWNCGGCKHDVGHSWNSKIKLNTNKKCNRINLNCTFSFFSCLHRLYSLGLQTISCFRMLPAPGCWLNLALLLYFHKVFSHRESMAPFISWWMNVKSVLSSMTTGYKSNLSFGHVYILIVSEIYYVQTLIDYP